MDLQKINDVGRAHQRAARQGFSVVELMVILLIVGILLALGIPTFHGFIQEQRLTTSANALFMAVNMTRSEAIKRDARVDLVPAGDGHEWRNGWVIFIDEDNDQRPDINEKIIFLHDALDPQMHITARFTDSKVQYIAYTGSGRSRTNTSNQTAQAGSWLLQLGAHSRKIVINFIGRPRICNPHKTPATC